MNIENTAKSDRTVMKGVKTEEKPVFDFSKPPWNTFQAHAPFVLPHTEWAAEEQTHVRVLFDDQHLYLGITCECRDRKPEAGELGYEGEHVEIFFDPENEQKASIQLAVNSEGRTASFDHRMPEAVRIAHKMGMAFAAQIVPDQYTPEPYASPLAMVSEWRKWIREGIADQMTAKYISPRSPIFRDLRRECSAAGIPLYAELLRSYSHPNVNELFTRYFNGARRAGADAVNIYEGSSVLHLDQNGEPIVRHPAFDRFMREYPFFSKY